MIAHEFPRFLIAGAIAATANFGSRFIFNIFFPYTVAISLAFLVGIVVAFSLMRGHVFNIRNSSLAPQAIKFVGINVLSFIQTLAVSMFFLIWLLPKVGITGQAKAEALAHLVGLLVPIVSSYFGHKLITFKKIKIE